VGAGGCRREGGGGAVRVGVLPRGRWGGMERAGPTKISPNLLHFRGINENRG
jgi:hypothetical protein